MSTIKGISVIGGSRWARQLAFVASRIMPADVPLWLCSPSDPGSWRHWLAGAPARPVHSAVVDLEAATKSPEISHVIIARSPRLHAETAIMALEQRKAVLVEKPFAVDLSEAQAVVSASCGLVCMTGLVMLFASNLRNFATAARQLGPLTRMQVDWLDAAGETRYGEIKKLSIGLNLAEDVLPHVWSLVRLIAPGVSQELTDVRPSDGGRSVSLDLAAGDLTVSARIGRLAPARQRLIRLSAASGVSACIDFSTEPGHATVDGVAIDVATGFTSPLEREVETFLGLAPDDCKTADFGVADAVEAIALSQIATSDMREYQIGLLADTRGTVSLNPDQDPGAYALRELVAARTGMRDEALLAALVSRVGEQIGRQHEIDPEDFKRYLPALIDRLAPEASKDEV